MDEEDGPKSWSFNIDNILDLIVSPTLLTSLAMRSNTVSWSFSIPGRKWIASENMEGDPDVPGPADEGDIQMEYSCD